VGTIALLGLVLAPSAALAQIDLSGSWGARYHDDFFATMGGAETMYPEYMLKQQQASSSKTKPR
jgi:hypothetical protein